jgi:hypothetical protein
MGSLFEIKSSEWRSEMKMKQVAVIHTAFEETPRTVAFVNVPETFTTEDALEYAFKRTNNIMGSWSKPQVFEWNGEVIQNEDFSEDVTVVAELPRNDAGVEMGLRSTSMGDQMLFGTTKYKVAWAGFEEIT